MAENSRVRAPYNFVPFSSKVLTPYESVRDLPRHDELRTDLKSGEIQVSLRAETPVFVSDGDKKDPHFFRGANGKYMIPGSTIRGMSRENMQILGFGLIRPGEDLEDYQIYFREMASATGSVNEPLKKYYQGALGIQSKKSPEGKAYTIPENVCSGYIFRDGNAYYIRPTAEPFIRVSRKMKDVQQFGAENARVIPVSYQAADGRAKQIRPASQSEEGLRNGVLLYTGRPVGRQPNHLYLFPEADQSAQAIQVSAEDIISYQADLESRANSLKAYYPVSFWELPKDGENKPVFFAHHEGHLYFGMSLFLRIGYKYSLSAGLPKRHREMLGQETCPLDYPHAILGFATNSDSYRSRVSFGDLEAVGMPRELETRRAILGDPKPSYYPGYVADGRNYNDVDPTSDQDTDRFQLRGYKQYWMKPEQETAVPDGKDKVGTTLRPLPAGTEFRGTIRFRNLTEQELGLLLWSLRLDDGCFQTVGMGKPYGYGRMSVQIEKLRELDLNRLYGADLAVSPWADTTDRVPQYIDAYDGSALGTTGKKKKTAYVRKRPEIQDFFFIKRSVRDGKQESYMDLDEYKNVREPLPAIRKIREDEEPNSSASSSTLSDSVPANPVDPYEALRNKFKKL